MAKLFEGMPLSSSTSSFGGAGGEEGGGVAGEPTSHHPVVIIGSGPAAHSAAVYCARAELEPVVFEGFMAEGIAAGGQLTTTTHVENFLGHVSIQGPELCEEFRKQSIACGATIFTETVEDIQFDKSPFILSSATGRTVSASAIIIATGATARRLDFSGAEKFWMKGISACAVCDGALPIFRNKPLVVIGGGDSACEEALYLTKFASQVSMVVRRDELRASATMARRAKNHPQINILFEEEVVFADGEAQLESVVLRSSRTGEERIQEASGLFFAIGHDPATRLLQGAVSLDDDGYVLVEPGSSALPADAAARLDAAMCEANPVYATWRGKGAIGPCECRAVRSGGFDALRRHRIDHEGASPQQLKVSRVVKSPEHLALLLRGGRG